MITRYGNETTKPSNYSRPTRLKLNSYSSSTRDVIKLKWIICYLTRKLARNHKAQLSNIFRSKMFKCNIISTLGALITWDNLWVTQNDSIKIRLKGTWFDQSLTANTRLILDSRELDSTTEVSEPSRDNPNSNLSHIIATPTNNSTLSSIKGAWVGLFLKPIYGRTTIYCCRFLKGHITIGYLEHFPPSRNLLLRKTETAIIQ